MYFKFIVKCVDGGWGWGNTGQRACMCFSGKTMEEAESKLKQHIPGGWEHEFVGETNETYYLKHLLEKQ